MTNEYNMPDDGVGFINGDMNLSDESPIETEISEVKNVKKMNESQFRNLVYEMTLKMLDEQLNENGPAAAGAPPMDPAAGGAPPMDPMAAGGAPMPQATDADTDGLPGKYFKAANSFKEKKAQEVGDKSGGAPGFNPQGINDDKKKAIAKQVAESIIKQLTKEFSKKK